MRIAMFTEVFLPKIDGVVTRVVRTLEHLAELGHEVLLFAPGDPPATYAGHRVVRVRGVSLQFLYPELKVGIPTPNIARAMDAFQPHVVHAVNPIWLAAYGVLSAGRRDLPQLASFHTDVPNYTESLRIGWLRHPVEAWTRYLHNRSGVNLCTSDPMVERAREVGIRRVGLWPKAVDTVAYHPGHASAQMRARLTDGVPQAPLVVYVGRMSREKNLDQLIEPMRRLRRRVPGVRLAMVGSGPQVEELKDQFDPAWTVFTGYMSGTQLAQAYASADVFAFPSTTETLGLVALESMASQVPVVGARAGGVPFVIDDGETGFLVDPHDTEGWVDRLEQLLTDQCLRERMGVAARKETERHSWRAATEALVRFYNQAIQAHR
ncbi:glycosyltransferase family 4 protein [Garicola koreensis]|uniref:D-inositol 3-phosphate glycosyltransferase n=1 Tax=Garicola koreensis TaxID=1262554 RepID=A0A7W5Y0F7_9MICC|nr:glycosyltransferase family 1 protein [Garicola koreensis]MBB3667208.1 glycosyltransferase involved in cell wall biosynthesis [Garicola koreensis]